MKVHVAKGNRDIDRDRDLALCAWLMYIPNLTSDPLSLWAPNLGLYCVEQGKLYLQWHLGSQPAGFHLVITSAFVIH